MGSQAGKSKETYRTVNLTQKRQAAHMGSFFFAKERIPLVLWLSQCKGIGELENDESIQNPYKVLHLRHANCNV